MTSSRTRLSPAYGPLRPLLKDPTGHRHSHQHAQALLHRTLRTIAGDPRPPQGWGAPPAPHQPDRLADRTAGRRIVAHGRRAVARCLARQCPGQADRCRPAAGFDSKVRRARSRHGPASRKGWPLIHPERSEIEIEHRLLLDSAVPVLLSYRYDLSHDLHIEAVRLGLAVDILDVAGQRLLLLFEALDPLNEGAQMPGVDLARRRSDQDRSVSPYSSCDLAALVERDGSRRTSVRVKARQRVFPGDERSSARECRNPRARATADRRESVEAGGRSVPPMPARSSLL